MSSASQHIRLSELNALIEDTIRKNFQDRSFWIVADITNHSFKERSSYHYFDLVEKDPAGTEMIAKVAGKAWGNGSLRIKAFEAATGQQFTNNINVLVNVKVVFHKVYGLSLEVVDIDSNFTLGLLEKRRRETLERLVNENEGVIEKIGEQYITRNSKLPLPSVIKKIAVVSSKTSAGNEDFKHSLVNNPYGYLFEIDDYHTTVQNEAYAQEFLNTLIGVFHSNIPYDVVVINRGGGAQNDFLIFDNYNIGRAIARFPIPVITGIGHQKNETIADLMAHTATKTPTKAAEFIIAHNKKFEDMVLLFQKRIIIKSQQLLASNTEQIHQLNTILTNRSRTYLINKRDIISNYNSALIHKTREILYTQHTLLQQAGSKLTHIPKVMFYQRSKDLESKVEILKSYTTNLLKNQKGYLSHYISLMQLMAPDNILKKGFAIIKHKGSIVSSGHKLGKGDEIEVVMEKEIINAAVTTKKENDGKSFNL